MDPAASGSVDVTEGDPRRPLWGDDEFRQLADLTLGTDSVAEEVLFERWKVRGDILVDWTAEERRHLIDKWHGPPEEWTDKERDIFSLREVVDVGDTQLAYKWEKIKDTAFHLGFWKSRMGKSDDWTEEEKTALLARYFGPEARWTKLDRFMFCQDVNWYKDAHTVLGLEPSDAMPSDAKKEQFLKENWMPNYIAEDKNAARLCGWTEDDRKKVDEEDQSFLQGIGVHNLPKKKQSGLLDDIKALTEEAVGQLIAVPYGELDEDYKLVYESTEEYLEILKDASGVQDVIPDVIPDIIPEPCMSIEERHEQINKAFADKKSEMVQHGYVVTNKLVLDISMVGT